MVTPLLTDLYQFTMAYAYWKADKHQERAVFDLYFPKNPFGGEYTVFAGLEECIRFIANFKFTEVRSLSSVKLCLVLVRMASVIILEDLTPLLRIEGPIAAPYGGIGASKCCYIGGFDATSNVVVGRFFGIPLRGTHSHAFVSSYMSLDEIVEKSLQSSDGLSSWDDFVSLVQTWLDKIKVSCIAF
ncbi:hypothetical protein GH714_014927 [Hevea brasiliensis]|uniref:nicotinate phosphoribosyltransferase n=1 Tax=Hevea brasiliensis TaxID=3981 RepID=A0A6A6KRG5_HEVBR|nr:hypothetical protein GH714_014927 [Hevea brasiliensis]